MKPFTRKVLTVALLPLFAFVAFMQNNLNPDRNKFQPGEVTNIEIGGQFIAATLIGLREVVAGLLWVRCDTFFHQGNYDAVVPIVRIVTWLDPKQIDVYDTGAWHLSYNFTDSQERSDRRYIPASRALLREGIANNPNVFDLYFQLGWLNFHKVQDGELAVPWFTEANTRPRIDPATGLPGMRPQYVGHTLAHSFEKAGEFDKAIQQWRQNLKSNLEYTEQYEQDSGNLSMVHVAENNLARLMLKKRLRQQLAPVQQANFEAYYQILSPRRFRVWGTLDLPDGARVKMRLTDKDFKEEQMETFTWNVDPNQTVLEDSLYVRDGRFGRTIDIERDSALYPLKADQYRLTFTFDPRWAPDNVQASSREGGAGVLLERLLRNYRSEGNPVIPYEQLTRMVEIAATATNLPDPDEDSPTENPTRFGAIGWLGNGLADQPNLVQRGPLRMFERSFILNRSDLL